MPHDLRLRLEELFVLSDVRLPVAGGRAQTVRAVGKHASQTVYSLLGRVQRHLAL